MKDEPPLLEMAFNSEDELYLAYMPFVQGGGLFIRTNDEYPLGSTVLLSVQFFQEVDNFIVEGQVIWLTPSGAQRNKPVGIGIQFTSENGRQLCNKIETYLAGMLKSSKNTDTF